MKTSLIVTILNEELSIESFLHSVLDQTVLPDEVVIVDGGSTDTTLQKIQSFKEQSNVVFPLKLYKKKGNRSVGRNEAIKNAANDIMLVTDAGCILDKHWVKEIIEPFKSKNIDVVAGYYSACPKTLFEKCLVPYVLIMPDQVNEKTFLPAARSMALRREVWEEMNGFDVLYSHNEDYVFAKKLKKKGKTIAFAKKAIVYWIPRKNVSEAFTMFKRFAYGDMEASLVRPKVILLFLRYSIALLLVVFASITHSRFIWEILGGGVVLSIVWSIKKNYRYVNDWKACYYLPLIQLTCDIAVLLGSSLGFLARRHLKQV